MEFEPNYGSSEYSKRAEELFAGFLLKAEEGDAGDFEGFCAQHESYCDELYGLHADWDNVRGLLAQLEGRRSEPNPEPLPEVELSPPSVARREGAVEPFSAKDVPDPEHEYSAPPSRAWKVMGSVGVLLAVISVIWAAQLTRNSKVLASEKRGLVEARNSTRGELELERATGRALAQREAQLKGELATTLKAKNKIEIDHAALGASLEQEQARGRDLESQNTQLGEQFELERARHEESLRLSHEARAQASILKLRLRGEQLIARRAELWPSNSEQLPALATWLDEAEDFAASWEAALATNLIELELADRIAPLVAKPGLLERAKRQQFALERWQEASEGASESYAAYAELELAPQFGLVALGQDPLTGLWRFEDWRSAPRGALIPGIPTSGALLFVLIPGLELEGHSIPAFFVSEQPWSREQRDALFGRPAHAAAASSLQDQVEYELDLLRMGYQSMTSLQVSLMRQYGIDAPSWSRFAVRAQQGRERKPG